MISSFLNVGSQVLVLFILVMVGIVLTKLKILTQSGVSSITELVLYVVSPCLIINAFLREYDSAMMKSLFTALLCSVGILSLSVIIAKLLFGKIEENRAVILKFAVVFSNCGFMSIPLQQALLGDEGVFYGAVFLAVFNFFMWSYGLITMSGEKKPKMMIKALVNPGIIGTAIGIILFIFSIRPPEAITSAVDYLASMNTALPMLVIGYYLATSNLKRAFSSLLSYIAMALRLIVIPLLTLIILFMLKVDKVMLQAIVISVSSPVATFTTMFSAKYGRDTELSVGIVAATALLSMITIPIVVGLAQYITM